MFVCGDLNKISLTFSRIFLIIFHSAAEAGAGIQKNEPDFQGSKKDPDWIKVPGRYGHAGVCRFSGTFLLALRTVMLL